MSIPFFKFFKKISFWDKHMENGKKHKNFYIIIGILSTLRIEPDFKVSGLNITSKNNL